MAPFFLPTVSNVNGFQFDLKQNDSNGTLPSKISKLTSINMFLSDFGNKLLKASSNDDCKCEFHHKKTKKSFHFSLVFKSKKY